MSIQNLGIVRLTPEAILPKFATTHSACFDIHCDLSVPEKVQIYSPYNFKQAPSAFDILPSFEGTYRLKLDSGCRAMVPTGIALDIPEGYYVEVYARSGLSLKKGLRLVNSVGVIDSDYKEELFVLLENSSKYITTIEHSDRICQARLVQLTKTVIEERERLTETDSTRKGGFGSTGVKL